MGGNIDKQKTESSNQSEDNSRKSPIDKQKTESIPGIPSNSRSSTPDGFVVIDKDGNCRSRNPSAGS